MKKTGVSPDTAPERASFGKNLARPKIRSGEARKIVCMGKSWSSLARGLRPLTAKIRAEARGSGYDASFVFASPLRFLNRRSHSRRTRDVCEARSTADPCTACKGR
jgi:hypothetical protein